MDTYAVEHQTAAGTDLTILEIVTHASGTSHGKIVEFGISSSDTPSDITTEFNLIRGTAAGIGTSLLPRKFDSSSPASRLSGQGGTFTGQTKTANSNVFNVAINVRASYRWVARRLGGIYVASTPGSWVGIESINSGGMPLINAYIQWKE